MRNNRRNTGKSFAVVLLAVLFLEAMGMMGHPADVFAQGGPPMITDDPGTPGTGHWENNFAFALDNTPSEHLYETPIVDLNYGWGSRVQLKLEVPWVVVKTPGEKAVTGLANIDPGIKIRFLDEDSFGVDVATYPSYRFNYTNISSILFGNQFFLPLEVARTFGNVQLDAEVGIDFIVDQPGQWNYGVVGGYNSSSAFQWLAELHATSQTGTATEVMANIGCHSKITDALYFIGSAGKNLTPSSYNEYVAYLGLQVLVE